MPEEVMSDLELSGVRADAAALFTDTCTITRVTDKGTPNTTTGVLEGGASTTIYTGPCSVYPIMSRRDRFDEFGQGLIFSRQYRVIVPYTTDTVQIRDVVTVTVSDDTQLVGRPMGVRDVVVSTLLGYRRLTVQDAGE